MSDATTTYILDANLLLRLADVNHPMHAEARDAITSLRTQGATLRTVPQSIFEFWTVATRGADRNGLGLTVSEASTFVSYFLRIYWPIPDDPSIITHWCRLVENYQVVGKQGHDARYVAAMQSHGLTQILTFDSDFGRYTPEGILPIHPSNVKMA